MGDRLRSTSMEDLPVHLILEILMSGRLAVIDLISLELTSRTFRGTHGLFPKKFKSLVDYAAFQLCGLSSIYASLHCNAQEELLRRCNGNWKRLLRFLMAVEQSSDMVETSAGNMQIRSGRYHTLLINDSAAYSCGSSLCGVLGHGPETTQCVEFTQINFPVPVQVAQVSASLNHAAFVTGSGQVAAGLSFTMFLTRKGHVFTCGTNGHGQLGHGDTSDRPTPTCIELLASIGSVVQIAAGPSYALAVSDDGTLYSFGSGTNFCLGHGEQQNELQPRAIQSFKRRDINVARVSAGDEHVVALDSTGYVYTWGKGYCGALGHGDEIDKTTPSHLTSLKSHLAVQVCASKRKTFVLVDDGSVYGFGWMGFGSLGFLDRGASDKVLKPRILESLRSHHISQISTGLYHSVVVTNCGRVFGFGDNERAQLGHDAVRGCLEPTEMFMEKAA